jgi:hypothetical protein
LATNCIALDARIQRILSIVGAPIEGSLKSLYEQVESALIQQVAKPCGLSGVLLDRILFQNYDEILKSFRR